MGDPLGLKWLDRLDLPRHASTGEDGQSGEVAALRRLLGRRTGCPSKDEMPLMPKVQKSLFGRNMIYGNSNLYL